jgi:hypothetical protein
LTRTAQSIKERELGAVPAVGISLPLGDQAIMEDSFEIRRKRLSSLLSPSGGHAFSSVS